MKTIDQLHQDGKYRPTVISLLYHYKLDQPYFLLVNSAKSEDQWHLPQGGIKRPETLEEGLARELNKELGINLRSDVFDLVVNRKYIKLKATENTPYRLRGQFTKGKAYFFASGRYIGEGNFQLKPDEVKAYRWATADEVTQAYLSRPDKLELIKTEIKKVKKR